jgi:iduronate 2-sulfatase
MKSLCLAAFVAFVSCVLARAAEKPNVLFICVDDLKPTLGCYGDQTIKSPNFDRLAARGIVFERAYCNQAVCAPSRNSLMTGRRPTTLGIYDLGTNFRKSAPDAITLTQHFMKQGYRAEGLGKIFHVGHGNHEDAASWSVPHWPANSIFYALPENRAKQGLTREEALFSNQSPEKLPRGAAYEAADVTDEMYPDGRIAAEAIARLRAAKDRPGTPFFIAVGFLKPHLPFCAPKKYWDLYERAAFALPERRTPPEGAPPFAPTTWGELRQYSDIPEVGPLNDDKARTLIHGYHAAVSYVDAQLGKLLDALDELELANNTIVVVWGDHGWHLGDHGMWCKHTNYEQAGRIPLIVTGPGIAKGRATALVESVDLYPTLAELAGLPPPADVEGRSFAATLRDPSAPTKDYVMHCYPRGERIGRALRTARYRLVEWKVPDAAAETAEFELYDYETDPFETRNLAAEKPELVAKLRAVLSEKFPEAKPQWRDRAAAEKSKQDRAAMFDRRDKNKDGQLSREEFLANQPDPDKAPQRFLLFDTNKDGMLSREEFIYSGKVPAANQTPR